MSRSFNRAQITGHVDASDKGLKMRSHRLTRRKVRKQLKQETDLDSLVTTVDREQVSMTDRGGKGGKGYFVIDNDGGNLPNYFVRERNNRQILVIVRALGSNGCYDAAMLRK